MRVARKVVCFIVVAFFSSLAFANSCTLASLAFLEAQPCSIGNVSFTFIAPNGVDANSVLVAPITSGDPGFVFQIAELAGQTSPIQSINFNVNALNGTQLNGLSANAGGGLQGAVENLCLGPGNGFNGFEPDGSVRCLDDANKEILTLGFGGSSGKSAALTPVGFAVTSTGFIANGSQGFAFLSEQFSVTQAPTPTPEPSTLLLLSSGSLCLARTIRKKLRL